MEEENYAAVRQVYRALDHAGRVRYHWYAGDHDFPPEARQAAVEWFKKWLGEKAGEFRPGIRRSDIAGRIIRDGLVYPCAST